MKRFSAIVAGMFLLCTTIYAFEQKEINVRSEKMNRDIPITVITPESYDTTKTFPVIYLLHGFSDNNTRWASTGVIGPLADQYDIIFVMPEADTIAGISTARYVLSISMRPLFHLNS